MKALTDGGGKNRGAYSAGNPQTDLVPEGGKRKSLDSPSSKRE